MITNLLVKKFVNNYEQVKDPRVRSAYGSLGSVVSMICDLGLFILKFVVGTAVGSMAVIADAFNNLSDMASAMISLFGARVASKPSDEKHPFGYGRMEYVVTFVVSFIILDVGVRFFQDSINKIIHPEKIRFSWIALILLLVSVGVKLWMGVFNRGLANKIHSGMLKATAADSMIDAVTTGVTIASLLIYVLAGINIDGVASLIVSVLVIWAGIGIIRDTVSPLIGQEMDSEEEEKIISVVREDQKVLGTHDLIIHSYGVSYSMATIHIEVSSRMTLKAAHTVADQAEKRVRDELGVILVVHVDPVDMENKWTVKVRKQVGHILNILDKRLSFHDLQVTFHQNKSHQEKFLISFDLVVPYQYKKEDEARVVYQVVAFMHELDPRNQCVITIDRGAVEEKMSEIVDTDSIKN